MPCNLFLWDYALFKPKTGGTVDPK